MKELKQGTPVWYKQLPDGDTFICYVEDYINGEMRIKFPNGAVVSESELGNNTSTTVFTVQQYIKHVMVPDGWAKVQGGIVNNCLFKDTSSGAGIYLYFGDFEVSFVQAYSFTQIDELRDFVELQQQALTHCEKLNLLKQLEI